MADDPSTPDTPPATGEHSQTQPKRIWLVAIVVAAVAIAVGIGLYVIGKPGGNTGGEEVAAGSGVDCSGVAETARALGAAATGDVAAMGPANPPLDLTALSFTGPDGKPMTLGDHTGKTVLVNLWATWCVPCREEMPALDALEEALGGEKFEVVAVNVDAGDDEKPKKFLSEIGVAHLDYYAEHSLGLFNDVKTRGLALGLPVTMLVDPKGCLLAHMNGPAAWGSEDAKAWVKKAIDAGS